MSFSLSNLTLSKWIEEKMRAVSKEDLCRVLPGCPVPEGAEVAGVLPDTLKAFLFTLELLDDECTREFDALIPDSDEETLTQAELAEIVSCMSTTELARWNTYIGLQCRVDALHGLFWAYLRSEFPQLQQYDRIEYGPEFQVYGVDFSNENEDEEGVETDEGGDPSEEPSLLPENEPSRVLH